MIDVLFWTYCGIMMACYVGSIYITRDLDGFDVIVRCMLWSLFWPLLVLLVLFKWGHHLFQEALDKLD